MRLARSYRDKLFVMNVRVLGFLVLLLGVVACGDDDEFTRCNTNADCPDELVCVTGQCLDPSNPNAPDAPPMCEASETACGSNCCASGQSCDGTSCCALEDMCNGQCCNGDCLAGECVPSCAEEETLCGTGDSAACCAASDVCYGGACITPGNACQFNRECADNEYCDQGIMRCLPRSEGSECTYMPPVTEDFEHVVEWSWTGEGETVFPNHHDVMSAPMVANLNDDNGDGVVDENDIPDVVFATFDNAAGHHYANGILRAVSGADGSVHWPTTEPSFRVDSSYSVAIAELDSASPGPEIVACIDLDQVRYSNVVGIVSATGNLLVTSEIPCNGDPSIADMNGDGIPEISVRNHLMSPDGTLIRTFPGVVRSATFANFDDDEDLEFVTGAGVWDMDGTALWTRDTLPEFTDVAVGDLNLDGNPEIVGVNSSTHRVYVVDGRTGTPIWDADVNPDDPTVAAKIAQNGNPSGGGPPTIANFDDDPEPEIALAGGYAYVVFNPDGSILWFDASTRDTSSRSTGSSVFDFEGDGRAEVLYNDELLFRVYRGNDGSQYLSRCNTSGTLQEYPIVVDVDNDGQAEIVLMENSYVFMCDPVSQGIHVFGHPENQWVSTRRIWNQHTYHVTNINEDGTVPRREQANWTVEGLNNFRQNVQPDGALNAPDLVAADLTPVYNGCNSHIALRMRVVNEGSASAPAGIPVTFYEVSADPAVLIGTVNTTRRLLPGESEVIELSPGFEVPDPARTEPYRFQAVINDPSQMPLGGVNECRPDNNSGGPVSGRCPNFG